ncbi:unnamed protein product, partial [Linum tenue]
FPFPVPTLEKKNAICNQFGEEDRESERRRYQIRAPSHLSQSSFALYPFLERMKAWNKRCNQFPPKESDVDDEHGGEGQSGEGEKSWSTINSPAIGTCRSRFCRRK